ncbi:hypothetical protein MtrunA17_Chr6g0462221 [Medicago truncatula]|uniref:Uncharacterized protein n=1 Tax=Medicago truncatula TaxID=3880 RepID=A0A396HC57_MEDTR|nr:hypothetical protein MtrunA17_Chr6g0462221 [Medicago truncatula]
MKKARRSSRSMPGLVPRKPPPPTGLLSATSRISSLVSPRVFATR